MCFCVHVCACGCEPVCVSVCMCAPVGVSLCVCVFWEGYVCRMVRREEWEAGKQMEPL